MPPNATRGKSKFTTRFLPATGVNQEIFSIYKDNAAYLFKSTSYYPFKLTQNGSVIFGSGIINANYTDTTLEA
jgi:hypothetical protein